MNIRTFTVAAALGSGSVIGPAFAAPITVGPPWLELTLANENDIGFATDERISYGDTQVVPNGSRQGGTTGSAQTTDLVTGAVRTFPLPWAGTTSVNNSFGDTISYSAHPNLIGPWTLTFTNAVGPAPSPNTVSVTTLPLVGVTVPPFAQNVTVSGLSANPTFSWSYKSGSGVDGVQVNIYDDTMANLAGNGVDQVYSVLISGVPGPSNSSFTVPTALAGGLTLQKSHKYTIGIFGTILRNPALPPTNENTAAKSEAFFDFTPLPAGSPLANLPAVTPAGVYQYSMSVVAGTTYFVDPTVAVGYSFAIGAGDPNFASVLLPAVQANPFNLSFVYDGVGYNDMLAPETVFDFPSGGVDAFNVTGIDPSDGLDPADTTAFITGLTFTGDGTFDGTQTPITEEVAAAPEPGSIALLATGLFGWRSMRRRRQASPAA
jgi:PEP-CTERM motif